MSVLPVYPSIPDKFKFQCGDNTVFTAERVGEIYQVSWGVRSRAVYSVDDVEKLLLEGVWIILSTKDDLLSKVKEFTKATNASVFICNGVYEVFYDTFDSPAKASTDEEMSSLMEAITTFHEASK